ncbi:MAG: Rieske 2Fe-2S domain-containing protein [bacterium]|nr:Rieske 2Fe-2S domain-containing protein [bacterium]
MEAAAQTSAKASKASKDDPSRRSMLRGIALGTGWATFGTAAAVSAGPAFVRFLMPNVLEEPDPKVRVGTIDKYVEMAPGDVNEDFKPQGVWMIRSEGQIAALNIICTHLGCIPNWLANDRKFKCPCHGSGFKASGINFEGPAPRPLERFRITEVDGQVIVDKSKKFQYERGEWAHPDSFLRV